MKLFRANDLFRSTAIVAGLLCLITLVPASTLAVNVLARYIAFAVAMWGVVIAVNIKQPATALKLMAAGALMNPYFAVIQDPGYARLAPIVAGVVFLASSIRLRAEPTSLIVNRKKTL